jgi:hypothetical protein
MSLRGLGALPNPKQFPHYRLRLLCPTQNLGGPRRSAPPNDRLAYFPTGSKSSKKLCVLSVLSGENLSPNYTGVILYRECPLSDMRDQRLLLVEAISTTL